MNAIRLMTQGSSLIAMASFATAAFSQGAPANTVGAATPATAARAADDGLGDIVVTARRRAETAQKVPISITALSAERLQTATVQSLNDLTTLAPGIRMSSEGGSGNSTISLRGLSKTPVGETLPAVVIYFAEVALPNQGIDVPTYDLANIQVLKGPQGTLFGRNTIGGAILMTPQAPTYDLGGYVKGTVGNFDLFAGEGAVNLPIVDGKVALRVAGQIRRRDGSIKNAGPGKDFRNVDQESFRASLLLEPIDGVTNTTIVDYFHANEIPNPAVAFRDQSAQFLGTFNLLTGGNGQAYVNAIQNLIAQQKIFGPFKTLPSLPNFFTRRKSLGIVNTTRVNVTDNIFLKNIFGWRKSELQLTSPADGFGPILPATGTGPALDLLSGGIFSKRELMSDELQVQGTALNDVVTFIAGGIYTQDKPVGAPNGNYASRFQFGGALPPSPASPALSSFITSKSYAVFGQVGIDASNFLLEGLKFNIGYRQTWDRIKACGTSSPLGFVDEDQCKTNLAGKPYTRAKDNEPTYTIGFDWQATPSVLIYGVHHRGFRAATVNSPLFTSPYTTGGSPTPPCRLANGTTIPCPDLRPFQQTKPEKVTDFEVGMKTNWSISDVRGRLNVAAYRLKMKGLVQFLQSGDLGVPASAPDRPQSGALGINLADQTVSGIEVEASIIPVRGLTLSANGSYVHHKIDAVNFPSIGSFTFNPSSINKPTPKFSGTATVEYATQINESGTTLVLNADLYHSSSYRPQSGVPLPGYNVLNGRIDLREVIGSNIDVGFWMKNVLNEKYIDAPIVISPAFALATGLYGERRTFGMDMRVRFGQ